MVFRLSPCKMPFKNKNEFGHISDLGLNLAVCAEPAPGGLSVWPLLGEPS